MNRIDRLFAILLQLQRHRRIRAADLARLFEVSERTIYRDIQALCECGVPVVSLPGVGYELSEGFFVPPLHLTPGEAQALSLSAHLFMTTVRGRLTTETERAIHKLLLTLPRSTRATLDRLAATMRFVAPHSRADLDDPRLQALNTAIQEHRIVHLRYYSYSNNEHTDRDIEPHLLSYFNGAWYVTAYCRLRGAVRDFRLERIDTLTLSATTFAPRPVARAVEPGTVVRVRFTPTVVRWVRERQHYAFDAEEDAAEGSVIMTYRVSDLAEIQPWLLSWGAAAEPLSPPALRSLIRQEAQAVLNFLT